MKIVIAHTRYRYESYTDYYELVRLSGLPTCFVDQIDLAESCFYIVTPINGEFRGHIDHRRSLVPPDKRRARIAWWNLERPDSDPHHAVDLTGSSVCNVVGDMWNYVDYVWVSDRYYQRLDPRMVYVTMGSDARLAEGAPRETFAFDLCHLSYVTHRRERVLDQLAHNHGMRVALNGWGAERVNILRSTRAMLNVHQTPAPIGEPLRFALTAAYGMPLLTEKLEDPFPMVPGRHCVMSSAFETLVPAVVHAFRGMDLAAMGQDLRRLYTEEYTFRACVEQGVAESLARGRTDA